MNDGIGTDTAATLALLADTNRAGRGGGYWGGEGGGYGGPFASQSSNAVRINRNADVAREQTRCIETALDQAEESRQFCSLQDKIFQSELRNSDRLRDIEREMNSNARAAADCCCDTKVQLADVKASLLLQSCNDKSEILAAIAGGESRAIERQRNDLSNELTALKTQVACNCHCPTS